MRYKLLAVDLDGTLLNSNATISKRNRASVRRAKKEGIRVIITTGRSFSSTKQYIRTVNVDDPFITYNGAVIYTNNTLIRSVTLEDSIISSLLNRLKEMDCRPIVYPTDSRKYFSDLGNYSEKFFEISRGFETELVKVQDITKPQWNNVIRISVLSDGFNIERLHSELNREFGKYIRTTDTYFAEVDVWIFEILDIQCSKAKSIEYLCNLFNIHRNQVIAIGDNDNDLDMISWAGLGVAMKNGLPRVLEVADYITLCDNDEDGVAEVIEKFAL